MASAMSELWVVAICLRSNFFQFLGAALGLLLAVGIFASYSQSPGANRTYYTMLSWKLHQQCQEPRTVTSELAQDPSRTPEEVFDALYDHHHHLHHAKTDNEDEVAEFEKKDALERAHACGNWGAAEPSKLFLRVCDPLPIDAKTRLISLAPGLP